MADAVIKKTYAATEAFFQDQNDQNQEFLDRINERQEEADCVSTNTASKVVKRDASGDFAAGTITAALAGNATAATTATTATKATNIAGGAAGSLPYQSGADTTALLAAGTEGQFLKQGASLPEWATLPFNWVEPGDTVLLEALTERSTTSTSYVEKKAFQLARPGRYKITGEARGSGSSITASICAYSDGLSGASVGAVATVTGSSYAEFTLTADITENVFINDIIRVKLRASSGTAYIRNVRVKYQDAVAATPAVVTD